MYSYFKGKVTSVLKNSIVLETNDIGREFLVSDPNKFVLDDYIILYCHEYIRDNERIFVGFRTKDEKNIFSKLIQVNELGPKTALSILKHASCEEIVNAINSNDTYFFERIPLVNRKVASKIIVDLNKKISLSEVINNDNSKSKQVFSALKNLGFEKNEIDVAISKVENKNLPLELYIQQALKILYKMRGY